MSVSKVFKTLRPTPKSKNPSHLESPTSPEPLSTMADDTRLNLNCLVFGDDGNHIFSVKIAKSKIVCALREAIKSKKRPAFDHIPADALVLWKVSVLVNQASLRPSIIEPSMIHCCPWICCRMSSQTPLLQTDSISWCERLPLVVSASSLWCQLLLMLHIVSRVRFRSLQRHIHMLLSHRISPFCFHRHRVRCLG